MHDPSEAPVTRSCGACTHNWKIQADIGAQVEAENQNRPHWPPELRWPSRRIKDRTTSPETMLCGC